MPLNAVGTKLWCSDSRIVVNVKFKVQQKPPNPLKYELLKRFPDKLASLKFMKMYGISYSPTVT